MATNVVMDINIKYFGKLTDIAEAEKETIVTKEGISVGELELLLVKKYWQLADEKYMLFKNNKIVKDKTCSIQHNDELSLMPPYSGG